ncbi:hypothetical protein KSP40_PGU008858 [Platanthera guangdongensis]|uniref:Uncharacterized protein n=1 Tax=Platanthera guangdongensis TaxID=2320717 RepID=A0ABR2LPU3_9ASPA
MDLVAGKRETFNTSSTSVRLGGLETIVRKPISDDMCNGWRSKSGVARPLRHPEKENNELNAQVNHLLEAVLPPVPGGSKFKQYSNREINEMLKIIATKVAQHTLQVMQQDELVTSMVARVTVKEVVPELFVPLPESEDGVGPTLRESEKSEYLE